MKLRHNEEGVLYPDIIATNCANSIKLEGVEFRIPCGKCLPCQKRRRTDWCLRLEHENITSDSALFITLTYDDVNLPFHYYKNQYQKDDKGKIIDRWKIKVDSPYPTTNKIHLQKYIKRLRYEHKKYYKKSIAKPQNLRYYAVGEYGSKTTRPHYHILLFNMDINNLAPLYNQWKHGHIMVGTVSPKSINYVTKYMHKDFDREHDTREAPFSLMSKKPIIGNTYLEEYGAWHIDNNQIITADSKGTTRRIPKAYLYKLWQKYQQVLDSNKKEYVWKMAKDTDKIKELTEKSYHEHYHKKIENFEKNLKQHYNNSTINYLQTQQSELKRKIKSINNAETL